MPRVSSPSTKRSGSRPRWEHPRDETYFRVLRCLAEHPGWVNNIIALELDAKRAPVEKRANTARKELGLEVTSDACSVFVADRTKYEETCVGLGITPLPENRFPRVYPTPDGQRVHPRDNPFVRRGAPPPEVTDPFEHLLRLLRDKMRQHGICRVTITPDSTLVGRIVETPLP